MKKNIKDTIYVCRECGEEFNKWSGICEKCKSWNTLTELKISKDYSENREKNKNIKISNLAEIKSNNFVRIDTKIGELNQVLGGGIVPGSVILIGGDPGIGKSTLLGQVVNNISNAIYVSGEESVEQIKIRIERLKLKLSKFNVVSETDIKSILSVVTKNKPDVLIIDSIQTMYNDDYPSTPGSIVQVRECALKLQQYAKTNHVPVILVGHITKDGNIAGPKILEHLVDVVLYLEGDRFYNNRILRAVKNRFGAVDEIGVFEMQEEGLIEVKNPSKIFLEEKTINIPGSVITATLEGNRPMLIEIQALLNSTYYGYPKRTASGFDLNRLNLIIAIISKRLKINLDKYDIYINVVGGLKIKDPGTDLAIAAAITSAYYNKQIKKDYCVFGELGLSGEIRKVKLSSKRIKEANKMGFNNKVQSKYISEINKEIF